MKTQTQPATAASPLARLGSSHGYRLDGDVVFLNASFIASPAADAGRSWRLRLVAGDVLSGHVVAEAALPPLSELTGAVENFEVCAAATPPAARGFHTLSLVLVSRDASGAETIHDSVSYAASQAFAQPRLCGPVGLWFENDSELVLDLDRVSNPRADGNLSGTLSVEVWAMDNAYAGGDFAGQPVAGAILGALAAGETWHPGALHLRASRPAAAAHLVVMLREWNGSAYATRDFVTFAPAPAAVAAAVSAAPEAAAFEAAPAPAKSTKSKAKAASSASPKAKTPASKSTPKPSGKKSAK